MKKNQESLLQALIKRDMLLVATCCTRFFVSVISSFLYEKVMKVFCTDSSRHVPFIRQNSGCYNQEYRSPIKHFTQMYSDCVPGEGVGGAVIPYIGYIGVCGAKHNIT